jgi:two-component system, cell cycle sensor histidine kinase and response regulator CckA
VGPSHKSSDSGVIRILLVDDDDYVRDVMAMVLEGLGYAVTVSADGFEGLWWLETQPYDLVISDLQMPGLDGPALYKEILARWPTGGPHVLFTSGSAETSSAEPTELPNVPLLYKPFSVDDLTQAIGRILATA